MNAWTASCAAQAYCSRWRARGGSRNPAHWQTVALKIETESNSSPGSDGPQMGIFDEEERGLERPSYEWVRKKNCEGAIR